MVRRSQDTFAFADMVPARVVLYMLSFSGFTVSFMMRNDINIAMVAMVKPPSATSETNVAVTSQQCHGTPNAPFSNNSTPIRLEVRSNTREICCEFCRVNFYYFSKKVLCASNDFLFRNVAGNVA